LNINFFLSCRKNGASIKLGNWNPSSLTFRISRNEKKEKKKERKKERKKQRNKE
jgi:hypothetical protein